ncbi:hypothetical protein AX17_001425 [Amanita inopinata Kibby_2008]|nr:hypothetical protein AX17_001425 [Amanita inopinata Kibby_2008]
MQPTEDGAEAVRKLRQYIASLDFKEENLVQNHKDIYTYIEKTILAPQSTILNIVPPIDVLIYAAKNILFPSLAHDLMPQLLDVIATVEFYRHRTLAQADNALVWNQYYKTEDSTGSITLTDDEETFLKRLGESSQSWREVYMTILCKCCHFDLYHVWITIPPSMSNFMIHFNEYFPFLNKYCTQPSPRLLHHTLSQDEQRKLGQTGLSICAFGHESAQWVTERAQDQPHWTLYETAEFHQKFPPPCASKHLVKLICNYLDYVGSIVQKVDDMFRDKGD